MAEHSSSPDRRTVLAASAAASAVSLLGLHEAGANPTRKEPKMAATNAAIRPFHFEASKDELADLKKRVAATKWPDREQVDIPRYLRAWREHHGTGSLSVITARGCPYRCNWCSHSVYGMTHRRRSPQSVVDEVEWLLDRYQPEAIHGSTACIRLRPDWRSRLG